MRVRSGSNWIKWGQIGVISGLEEGQNRVKWGSYWVRLGSYEGQLRIILWSDMVRNDIWHKLTPIWFWTSEVWRSNLGSEKGGSDWGQLGSYKGKWRFWFGYVWSEMVYDKACQIKFRLRELTSCLCSTAASAVWFEGRLAGLDTTETWNEVSQSFIWVNKLVNSNLGWEISFLVSVASRPSIPWGPQNRQARHQWNINRKWALSTWVWVYRFADNVTRGLRALL